MKYIIKFSYAIFFPIFRMPYTDEDGNIIVFNNSKSVDKYMEDHFLFNRFLGYYCKAYPMTEKLRRLIKRKGTKK